MITRITAGAFLVCNDKILLMKRGLDKELAPGFWANIGGHMDLGDITNPRALNLEETCYREVKEETGIDKSDIRSLALRYITMRKDGLEIRLNYHYIGNVKNELPVPAHDEGEFFWVYKKEIHNLPMTFSVKQTLTHWLTHPESDHIILVVVNSMNDSAEILEL